jgi:hypothetical protein
MAKLRQTSRSSNNNAFVAQVGGDHYGKCSGRCPHCGGAIQHWDLYAQVPYLEAQVARYTLRWTQKGQMEDLLKARSFLDKLIAIQNLSEGKD